MAPIQGATCLSSPALVHATSSFIDTLSSADYKRICERLNKIGLEQFNLINPFDEIYISHIIGPIIKDAIRPNSPVFCRLQELIPDLTPEDLEKLFVAVLLYGDKNKPSRDSNIIITKDLPGNNTDKLVVIINFPDQPKRLMPGKILIFSNTNTPLLPLDKRHNIIAERLSNIVKKHCLIPPYIFNKGVAQLILRIADHSAQLNDQEKNKAHASITQSNASKNHFRSLQKIDPLITKEFFNKMITDTLAYGKEERSGDNFSYTLSCTTPGNKQISLCVIINLDFLLIDRAQGTAFPL